MEQRAAYGYQLVSANNSQMSDFHFFIINDKSINAGDDIYMSDNGSNQSIGTVVSAVQEDGNKISGLAVLRVEAAQQNQLSIGSPTGLHATVLSLPYDIPVNK